MTQALDRTYRVSGTFQEMENKYAAFSQDQELIHLHNRVEVLPRKEGGLW